MMKKSFIAISLLGSTFALAKGSARPEDQAAKDYYKSKSSFEKYDQKEKDRLAKEQERIQKENAERLAAQQKYDAMRADVDAKHDAMIAANRKGFSEKMGVDEKYFENTRSELDNLHSSVSNLQARVDAGAAAHENMMNTRYGSDFASRVRKSLTDGKVDVEPNDVEEVINYMRGMDIMADYRKLQTDLAITKTKSEALMSALDNTQLGFYVNKNAMKLLDSAEFCSAAKEAAKPETDCSKKKKFKDGKDYLDDGFYNPPKAPGKGGGKNDDVVHAPRQEAPGKQGDNQDNGQQQQQGRY